MRQTHRGRRSIPVGAIFAVVIVTATTAFDAESQTTRLASIKSNGRPVGGGPSHDPSVSFDGRFVAFHGSAQGLVPGDPAGSVDVFVHDLLTGETSRVSVDSDGVPGNDSSSDASISGDGRFVAFQSLATNLVPGDVPGTFDAFVHDRSTSLTTCVSLDMDGLPASGRFPSLSADGRYVAFRSGSPNIVPGDANGMTDVFVHDRETGTTERVSVDSSGQESNGPCAWHTALSADGRFVTFISGATNLVPGDSNGSNDVFVHDRDTGETTRVSVDSLGAEGNGGIDEVNGPAPISADGRFIAFASDSSNLVPGDGNDTFDIFVHDRASGETTRVSVDSAGMEGQWLGGSAEPSISADGRFVAFNSFASSLVGGDTNGYADIFVHDRDTSATVRVSVDAAGRQADTGGLGGAISGDGLSVAFHGFSQLVHPYDVTNGMPDVFVRDLHAPSGCEAGTVNAGAGPVADVLFIDGSAGDALRIVDNDGQPFQVRLDLSPSGPAARYVVWVWKGYPSHPRELQVHGSVLGCTVNPTPLEPFAAWQPVRCLRGAGVPPGACGSATSVPGVPSLAPWIFTSPTGLPSGAAITLQGVIEDDGAANSSGFSVTNAVIVRGV